MRIRCSLVVCLAVVLALSTSETFASPCAQEIDRMQSKIDAKLEAQTAAGPSAREHRSHNASSATPGSIAAAEVSLDDISPEKAQAVETLMTRAREADRANDPSTCEQALAEVQRVPTSRARPSATPLRRLARSVRQRDRHSPAC